jgi:nucleoid-associated protein YgaU
MRTASIVAGLAVIGLMGLAHIGPSGAATSSEQDRVRNLAEKMAEAASKEFSAVLERERSGQAALSGKAVTAASGGNDFGPLHWLLQSRKEFQSLMRMLAGDRAPSQPWDPVADASRKTKNRAAPSPEPTATKTAEAPAPTVAAAGAQPAVTKSAAEERELAQRRRGASDRGAYEPGRAKSGPKAHSAKTGEVAKVADQGAEGKRGPAKVEPESEPTKTSPGPGPTPEKKARRPKEPDPLGGAKVAANAPLPSPGAKQGGRDVPRAEAPPGRPVARGSPLQRTSPAACQTAGTKVEGSGWYIAREGDSLWSIAEAHFGSGKAYRRIRAANRRIRDPDRIYPCQRIYVPAPTSRRG